MLHTPIKSHPSFRFHLLCAGIIFCAALGVFLFSFSARLHQAGDSTHYAILGMSLATGHGFSDISIPGNPHGLWWPPGFPLLIAGFYALAGAQWAMLKAALLIAFFTALYFFSMELYRRAGNRLLAVLITASLSINTAIHMLSSYLYSETWFLTSLLIFFTLWWRWSRTLTIGNIFLLSLLALYIASIRNIGLVLPLSFGLFLSWHFGDSRQLLRRVVFLIPILLVGFYSVAIIADTPIHVQSFRAFFAKDRSQPHTYPTSAPAPAPDTGTPSVTGFSSLQRVCHNFALTSIRSLRGYALTLIPQSLFRSAYFRVRMNSPKAILCALVTAIVLLGWWRSRRRFPLMNLYALMCMGVLFYYGPAYLRLVIPLLPMLVIYFFCGIYQGASLIFHTRIAHARIFTAAIGLLLLFDNSLWTFRYPRRTMKPQFADSQYQKCIAWVRDHATSREIIASQVYGLLFLLRGGKNIPFYSAGVAAEFCTYFDYHNVDYVMVSSRYTRDKYTYMDDIRHAIDLYPGLFSIVYGTRSDDAFVVRYDHR